MNTDVMFSSKTDMWATPQAFFNALNEEFHFTLDVCATYENAKCVAYYTKFEDGLSQPWRGVCWCNPPYGREIGKWVKKPTNPRKKGQPWSCCSRQELIPPGFTTTFITRPLKFDLSEVALNSEAPRTARRFRVW